MKIAVAGTGYVGLVAGVCFAEVGHNVTCVDVDEKKVELMKSGVSPIYEEDLEGLMQKNYSEGRLNYTTDYKAAYKDADAIFIGVGTPDEMSIVGPRPALYNQLDLRDMRTEVGVHKLVPGLTGWAQINGRDEIPLDVKVGLDKEYLDKKSFLFDLKIIFLTVIKVLKSDGVKEGKVDSKNSTIKG